MYSAIAGPTDAERDLHDAGVWFDFQLQDLRAASEALSSPPGVSSADLFRRAIGVVNRDALVAFRQAEKSLTAMGSTVSAAQLIQNTVQLATGTDISVSGLVESSAEALRFELMRLNVLQVGGKASGDPLQLAVKAANLSILYHVLDQLWLDCLWNDWSVMKKGDRVALGCSDVERAAAEAVSEYRREQLDLEHSGRSLQAWDWLSGEQQQAEQARPRITAVVREGKRLKLKVSAARRPEPSPELLLRLRCSETYLRELMALPLPNWNGLTISRLLDAWELLSPLARLLPERQKSAEAKNATQLQNFSFVVLRAELERALQTGLGGSIEDARVLLDKFIWTPNSRSSIWYTPFVPVCSDALGVLLAPLSVPNLLRSIEYWLSEGGLDLGLRGDNFEKYLRVEAADWFVNRSMRFARAGVAPSAIDLSIAGVGDLDLVIWVDDTVLVCETKCLKFPATPLEHHHYRERLREAADQLRVRRDALSANQRPLIDRLAKLGFSAPQANIVYCIVVNTPIGCLQTVDSFPVVDEYILGRYFENGKATMFGILACVIGLRGSRG